MEIQRSATCAVCGGPRPKGRFRYCSMECRKRPLEQRFWAKVQKSEDGCWLWIGGANRNGYGHITVAGRRRVTASRLAWELANGPIPDGLLVCHKCDVPRCVNPAHLFLGTSFDNMRDAVAKGRLRPFCMRGEAQPTSKLTDADVREIRSSAGDSYSVLAARFGVSRAAVACVITRKSWRHLP